MHVERDSVAREPSLPLSPSSKAAAAAAGCDAGDMDTAVRSSDR